MIARSLALLALLAGPVAAQEIGTVAAVNRDMRGTPPGESVRDKILGDEVVSDERIQTSAEGSGQLLFADQTALSVAPSSDIVLDRYVYDPDRDAGEMTMSLTRGTMRFIGGRITKQRPAVVRTPTATIGIRGGLVLVELSEGCDPARATPADCDLRVTALQAELVTVQTYGDADGDGIDDGPAEGEEPDGSAVGSVALARPGAVAEVPAGGAPRYAGLATAEGLAASFAAIEGRGRGGTPAAPDPARVERGSQPVQAVNSAVAGGARRAPVTTTGRVEPTRLATEAGTTTDDPVSARQDTDSIAQIVQDTVDEGMENDFVMLPDPDDVGGLTGTASYDGALSGFATDTSIPGGDPAPEAVSGRFGLAYDFDDRTGALDVEVPDGQFTVDVTAPPGNPASFAGQDEIFGGPDSIAADGRFLPRGPDPAGATEGGVTLDLGTRDRRIETTFAGERN